MFDAERWVSGWEEIGGRLYLGEGPFGTGGEMIDALLDMGPSHLSAYTCPRLDILRRQLDEPANRQRVIEFVKRRRATRGW